MENQQLLNSIATLSGVIDPLIRAKKTEDIDKIVKKITELVEKIK